MGWYELTSLISDSRVKFLIGFVIFSIIVAVAVTLVESRLRKIREKQEKKVEDESYVSKVRRIARMPKSPRERLDLIDEAVKNYFRESFGTHIHASYSTLIKLFEETKRRDFADFCRQIFSAYYSSVSLDDEKVLSVAKSFVEAVRKKEEAEEVSPSRKVKEKISKGLGHVKNSFADFFDSIISGWSKMQENKELESARKKEEERLKELELENERAKKEYERQKTLEENRLGRKELAVTKSASSLNIKEVGAPGKTVLLNRVPLSFGKPNLVKANEGFVDEEKKVDISKDSMNDKNFEVYPPVKKISGSAIVGKFDRPVDK